MDQVVNATAARALLADVCRNHAVAGWVVMRDQPQPGAFTARLVTSAPTPYVLTADSLAGIHDQLPPGLVRSDRQPSGAAGLGGDMVCGVMGSASHH